MKTYGAMKATEFSKKQIGIIYFKAKNGELSVEKWIMNELYDLADYYGYDDGGMVARQEDFVKPILDRVFANDIAGAQKEIDFFTQHTLSILSQKKLNSINRTLI